VRPEPADELSRPARRRRWPWVVGLAVLLGGLWFLVTDAYREEEKALRTQLREAVKESFPEEAAAYSRGVGLFRFEPDSEEGQAPTRDRGTVVLVHGMDDPGKVWRSLAPELHTQGFDAWLMEYPNDQPIAESAALLFEELKGLRARGVDRISIVAHSMGGLVSREMLTGPEVRYAEGVRDGVVPEVATFIMVATPNHGAPVARFRALGEVRDQIARVEKGEGSWLGGILDGAGEAKIDLLPESRFLTELNARPHPEGVEMLILAGVASPWSEADIESWLDEEGREATDDERERLDEVGAALVSLTRGLGDGLVSVESTRLEGVEHQTVEGTHLTMIRNVTRDSPRVPPAVPIVVERLSGIAGEKEPASR
jgi:pimeloyl-ACP methyl ester carboxylesterase